MNPTDSTGWTKISAWKLSFKTAGSRKSAVTKSKSDDDISQIFKKLAVQRKKLEDERKKELGRIAENAKAFVTSEVEYVKRMYNACNENRDGPNASTLSDFEDDVVEPEVVEESM